MFVITEADAAGIRAVFNEERKSSAVIKLSRRSPGVTHNENVRPEHRRGGRRYQLSFARVLAVV
jgi:hypothetical protein